MSSPSSELVEATRNVEVADVLTEATKAGQTVRPQGAAGWLDAWGLEGETPALPDRAISLLGFDKIVEYEPADLTMTVGAGVPLSRIADLTRPNKQWLALDPLCEPDATIGATVATGSVGSLRTGFGGSRDLVLGCTMVTGDGRQLELGGRVVKNVAGFDLLKLMIGGWGKFGVITQVTVRLNPYPTRDFTLVYESDDLGTLLSVGRALATAPVVPAALRLDLKEDSAQLLARVVGGEASAPVEADMLEDAAAGIADSSSIQTGEPSRAIWSQQQRAPKDGATELAMYSKPTRLPAMKGALDGARKAGWRIRCDITEGSYWVDGVDASLDAILGWADVGASLRILNADVETRRLLHARQHATGATVRGLVQRLTRAFDPAGVLQ